MTDRPRLTFILITDDDFEVCRQSAECLTQQTILSETELVIVCPDLERLNPDSDILAAFGCHRLVELKGSITTGRMIAAAIKEATAPLVMYVEEHNFPPPETASTTIAEFEDSDTVALGFGMLPANPGLVAWTHLYCQFAHAVAPVADAPADKLGGHHAAYRRDALLQYCDELDDLMANEAVLHEKLRRCGLPMRYTSKIAIPHVQVSRFGTLVRQELINQMIYADARANVLAWSPARRAIYVFGSPLIPVLRTARSVRRIFETGRARLLLPQVLPFLLVATASGAVGEALGYMFRPPEKFRRDRLEIELNRYSFVRDSDKGEKRPAGHLAE